MMQYHCTFRYILLIPRSTLLGIEWTPDADPSGMGVLIASEAQAITLATEGLLGVIFTIASLTDEAVGFSEVRRYFGFCFLYIFSYEFYHSKIKLMS